MDELLKLAQQLVNKPYDELLTESKLLVGQCYEIIKKTGADKANSMFFLICIIVNAISSDGKISESEYKFLTDLFPDNDIDKLIELGSVMDYDKVNEIVDMFGRQDKMPLCLLVLHVLAADKTITKDEFEYYINLLL